MHLIKVARQIVDEFGKDKVGQLSAAFAYTAIFAIGPLLIVVISVVSLIYGQKAVQGSLTGQLTDTIGPNAAKTIQHVIANTYQSHHGIFGLLIGIVGTVIASTALMNMLQHSLDQIFKVIPDPKAGWKNLVYSRVKNVVLLTVGSLIISVSVMASSLVSFLSTKLKVFLGLPPLTLEIINTGLSLLVIALVLYLIYRVLPDVTIPRKVAWAASFIVGVMFVIGKIVLGIIIGRNSTASAYGAAASLISLLLWFYYSGQILFLGAEGIKVYGKNHGFTYLPKKYALKTRQLNVNVRGALTERMMDSFNRGFDKKSGKK